jgi:hypothetical protein
MAQFNPKQFVYHYRNGKPAYYSYDEELYCGTFPENWVEDCLEGTGPRECGNCASYGSWNGVFLGYCANCAVYVYNGERGRGFVDIGKELMHEDAYLHTSVFDTYLKGVLPDDVGDKDFMDSAQLVYNSINNDSFEAFSDIVADEDHNVLPECTCNTIPFEEQYPDIDLEEVNAYYDECYRLESEREDENGTEVSYTLDYVGGGSCGGDYDGGYDSY